MTQSVMPYTLEGEESVVGGILLHPVRFSDVAAQLHPDDFHHPALSAIYAAMVALDEASRPIDALTVVAQLKSTDDFDKLRAVGAGVGTEEEKARAFLVDLQCKVVSIENLAYHARMVALKAERRRRIQVASEIAAKGFSDSDDEGFLEESDRLMLELALKRRGVDEPETQKTVGKQFVKELAERYEHFRSGHPLIGVTTGIDELDEYTAGLQAGDLVLVAGRPSMGKSSIAQHFVVSAAKSGKKACGLVFSLEMTNSQNMLRLVSSEARIDSSRLRKGDLDQKHFNTILRHMGGGDGFVGTPIMQLPLWWYDKTVTMAQIRAIARRWRMTAARPRTVDGKTEEVPAIIEIDYAQLVETSSKKKNQNREQDVAEVSRGCKALAKELKCPVVLLSQLNRELERRDDKRPRMSDLRESGALEQDADLILFIYRDEVYHPSTDEHPNDKAGVAEIIIGKQRNGPTGTVETAFLNSYTRFENLGRRSDEPASPRNGA